MSTAQTLKPLWDDLSLRRYLSEVATRMGTVEILALDSMRDLPRIRIETIYVPPLLAAQQVNPESDLSNWPQGQSLLDALEEHRRLVVLGDPGGGKTTLANWLAWRLSAGLSTPLPAFLEDRVPLPCLLRELSPEVFAENVPLTGLVAPIAQRLLGERTSEELKANLRARVEAGKYVLILDGVDEIPVAARKVVQAWVREASLQDACVLATSRIVGYDDLPIDRNEFPFGRSPERVGEYGFGLELQRPRVFGTAAFHSVMAKPANLSISARELLLLEELRRTSLLAELESRVEESTLRSPLAKWKPQVDEWTHRNRMPDNERGGTSGVDKPRIDFDEEWLVLGKALAERHQPATWAVRRYLMPFDDARIAAFATNWYSQRCRSEIEARAKAADLVASVSRHAITLHLARTPNLLTLMAVVHRERADLPDGKALLYDEIANAYINTIDSSRKLAAGPDRLAHHGWKERKGWLAYVGFQMQVRRSEGDQQSGILVSESEVCGWLAERMEKSGIAEAGAAARDYLGWVARRSGLLLPRGEGLYAFVHLGA